MDETSNAVDGRHIESPTQTLNRFLFLSHGFGPSIDAMNRLTRNAGDAKVWVRSTQSWCECQVSRHIAPDKVEVLFERKAASLRKTLSIKSTSLHYKISSCVGSTALPLKRNMYTHSYTHTHTYIRTCIYT